MHVNEQMYQPKEIAKLINKHVATVYTFIRSGELKATNVSTGNKRAVWRVTKEDFDTFMEARKK